MMNIEGLINYLTKKKKLYVKPNFSLLEKKQININYILAPYPLKVNSVMMFGSLIAPSLQDSL